MSFRQCCSGGGKITFHLNNQMRSVDVSPLKRLIDVLREDLAISSVKEGGGEGDCGACAIIIDDRLVNCCLVPVATVAGNHITTCEGIRETARGHRIVAAFKKEGSVQCGFCTPGMMVVAEGILRKYARPTEQEVRKELAGNLCRCTGYDMIVRGILSATQQGEEA